MALHKRKPLPDDPFDLIHKVLADFADGRLVRCNECKKFEPASTSALSSCSVCIYIAGRCLRCTGSHEKAAKGADRSVRAHISVLSRKGSVRRYGLAHREAWIKSHPPGTMPKVSPLRLMRGGKK